MSDENTVNGATPANDAAPTVAADNGAAGGAKAAMAIDAKLGLDVFKLDKEPHIVIDTEVCRTLCVDRACLYVCPASLYELDDTGRMTVNWEGCLECGTCMICCDKRALSWKYPSGPYGVQYRMS
jgi:ferredoxin like protein